MLLKLASQYKLNDFSIIMSDQKIRTTQGIINFDDSLGRGTHWVAYKIILKTIYYFAPYGVEPLDVVGESGLEVIKNTLPLQNQFVDDKRCGWLCINFLVLMKQYNDDYYKCLSILELNK